MISQTIAHCQITSKLGQSGMGEVYRATGTQLDPEVAIKTLPKSLAGDRERIVRFRWKAKTLAALNCLNYAVIHDIEETNGQQPWSCSDKACINEVSLNLIQR